MNVFRRIHAHVFAALALAVSLPALAEMRQEGFDADPGWDEHNNRPTGPGQMIRQDFGFSAGSSHAGGAPGEAGGFINPAAEQAWYAKKIDEKTLADPLSASGKVYLAEGGGHFLLGFFNADTAKEWRTCDSIVFRINQRSEIFHVHTDYTSSRWRAAAGVIGKHDPVRDRVYPIEWPVNQAYDWSIQYDPEANGGNGRVTATFADQTSVTDLPAWFRAEGVTVNRFGLLAVLKQYDGGGEAFIDDLTINGRPENFSTDPKWEEIGNRHTYESENVRPRFDFGYSDTRHAGGKAKGELGGLFFRGDCRYPEKLAHYGDRLSTLTLEQPLRASGKVAFLRGVTDSSTLLGFYHSKHSMWVNPAQDHGAPMDFLGVVVEGPSAEGFNFYPGYRNHGDGESRGRGDNPPYIYPDGAVHDWTLEYDPAAAGGNGRITVTLDGQATSIDFTPGQKAAGATFDRFGLVTPWIDGNGQTIFFDDLSYTSK